MRVALLIPLLAAACSPASSLSAERQRCIECALQAHRAPEAAAMMAERLTGECASGDARACSILGVMYERGTGRMHRPDMAAHLYRRACQGGNLPSCVHLGRLMETGNGAPRDLAAAEMTYELACHGGEAAGCAGLGRLLLRRGERKRGVETSRRACRAGEGESCYAMASLYRQGALRAPATDSRSAERARRYDVRACGLGFEVACARANTPLGADPGDARLPDDIYERSSSRATVPQ